MPLFGRIESETVALAIPILFVMGGILIAVTAIVMQARRKDLEHRERIIAMEKGIALPNEPVQIKERPKYSNRRANGLVLTGIGIALTIAMWVEDGSDTGVWGLIPLFIGIGLLIASHLDKKEWERERDRQTPGI
ncbi:MAG TPA: DUF6249 domain-containing protein [Candidatus Krumholzibacteria bacterium]|nr:DUF6249 domain-containing protein [Candidatus Krumholzibacteria bacterium]